MFNENPCSRDFLNGFRKSRLESHPLPRYRVSACVSSCACALALRLLSANACSSAFVCFLVLLRQDRWHRRLQYVILYLFPFVVFRPCLPKTIEEVTVFTGFCEQTACVTRRPS